MNFIQQAYKGKNEWYHWLVTILLVFFGWQILGVIPLVVAVFNVSENLAQFTEFAQASFMTAGIDKNLFLFLMILSFFIGLIFLFVGVKYVHKRSITSLITSREKIDWNRFFYAFFVWGSLAVVMTFIGIYLAPENYTWNFNATPFFILVAISLVCIPFQTSLEELLFRGYLMQGLGVLVGNRWVPLLITSVVFGLLHGANPEVAKLGQIAMVFYIGTGFLYGITTLMDEGTEIALGLHAVNNITAAFLVTTDWTVFQTDALYIDTSEPSVTWQMFIPVFLLYPLMLQIFSKKYAWSNWKEKLTGAVLVPKTIQEDNL
ncbi:CPBP family intramembrane glutamic endopeptidase [uncultured Polaribacter sp.]|uniref:CPBP family intramembrane glutamic endopeptidase n=1 Tax=uncultured Polaribacter sp. TaxID=174711 RepID=UPI0026297D16|nr:CPBP family intramembrane glutamic endopeptidase [uncultured Polaribacter sp.]